MSILILFTILIICMKEIYSFIPGMDGNNLVEIIDIFPEFTAMGPITYKTRFHTLKSAKHISAVVNVTRPIGPLGGAIALKDPNSGQKMTLVNVTNVCESVGMMSMVLPFPQEAFDQKCILKKQVYNFTNMPLEHKAPAMVPEGEYPLTLYAYEEDEVVLEMEVLVLVSDAKKKKKSKILEIEK